MSSNAFITQIKNQIDLHLGVDGKPPLNVDGEAFVVSLYGEWGIGKTHCLKALEALYQEALQATVKNDSAKSITIPVMFSPWRFEKEQHLIVPLVKTIQAKLEELIKADFLVDPKRKGLLVHLKNTGTSLANMALSLAAGFKFKVSLLGLIEGDVDFDKTLKHDKEKHKEIKELEEKARKKQLPPEAESLYYDTLTWLKKLCQPSKENAAQPALRFVLFIDDLDRCLPEKAVEMLESIKLFLDIPSFAFVIGVDNEVIERGIRHRYDAYLKLDANHLPITGHEYLEKIIHLPLMLPRMREDQARQLVETYRERAMAVLPTIKDNVKEPDQRWREVVNLVMQLVPLVPRKLIRAMEGLLFRLHVFAADHVDRTDLSEGMTLRFVVLQQLYPDIYRLVKIKPENWFRLLGVVVERGVLRIQDEWGSRDAFSLSGLNEAIGNIEKSNRPKDETPNEWDTFLESDETKKPKVIRKPLTGNPASDSLFELRDLLQAVQTAQQQRGSKDPLLVFRNWDDAKLELPSLAHSVYFSYGQFAVEKLPKDVFDFLEWHLSFQATLEPEERSARAQARLDLDFSEVTSAEMSTLMTAFYFDPAHSDYLKTLQDESWWDDIAAKVKTCSADVQKIWNVAAAKRMKEHQMVSPRYKLEDDSDSSKAKEVRDLKTGLIWRRAPEVEKHSFDDALSYAKKIARDTRQDWNIPIQRQLFELIDRCALNQAEGLPTIDHAAFPETPKARCWTSSPLAGGPGYAWYYDFCDGSEGDDLKSVAHFVRLVRSGQ